MARTWLSIRVELLSGGRIPRLHPAPGRVLIVGPRHTFADLAVAIDAAFARWDLSHLHMFELAGGRRVAGNPAHWSEWDTEVLDEARLRVARTVKRGERFRYTFDLGDDWVHRCTVAEQKVDPLEACGEIPDRPVPIWGWGSIPDQYGRRWDEDDGESPVPEPEGDPDTEELGVAAGSPSAGGDPATRRPVPEATVEFGCQDCDAAARNVVDGRRRCDRCANRALAAATGWPEPPAPPPAETLAGADGRTHRILYRLLLVPPGIEVLAEEEGVPFGEGYRVSVVVPHDADPARLAEVLRERVRQEIGRTYLERSEGRPGWQISGHELAGRVAEDPSDWSGPPRLVVDGRSLSWEQVGELVSPYVGWEFHLSFGDVPVPAASGDAGGTGSPIAVLENGEHPVTDQDDGDLGDLEEVLRAWEAADEQALAVLRAALPPSSLPSLPAGPLTAACVALRETGREQARPWQVIRSIRGWADVRSMPTDDVELWLKAAGAVVAMEDESGLEAEDEAAVLALERGDWLGAVVGLVRAGVGAPADPGALVEAVRACPEVDGGPDEDDAAILRRAFEVVLPIWEALGAVADGRRLTELGAWGLPRALAQSWGGDLEAGPVAVHSVPQGAPPGTRVISSAHYPKRGR